MSDHLLLVGTSERMPEVRHELAAAAPDEIIWLGRGDEATAWCSPLDVEPLRAGGGVADLRSFDELGFEQLRRELAYEELHGELARRALEASSVRRVRVPWEFPVGVADHLRAGGIEVVPDAEAFSERRRAKREWELDGMRAAGAGAQAALLEAARLLREELDGLTCERIREHMTRALFAHGTESSEILIHAGTEPVGGHALGFGPIEPDTPVQIDCFPRHLASGLFIDMSRTWVAGTPSDEALRCHDDVLAAHEVALADARPGVDDLYRRAAGVLDERGHPTRLPDGDRPEHGFTAGLGHGVGLEVHEAPSVNMNRVPLHAGDTIAIEPHLVLPGVGQLMVEDTVLVTDDGAAHLFEPLPYRLALPGT